MVALELCDLLIEDIDLRSDEFPHLIAFLATVYPFLVVFSPDFLDESSLECLKFLIHEAVDFFLAVSQLLADVVRQPLDVTSHLGLRKRVAGTFLRANSSNLTMEE